MAFSPGEVANYAVRVFLERMGRRYDEKRGLPRFNDRDPKTLTTVAGFFSNACPYCEGPLREIAEDHLISTNMTSIGLHAWGNVVWACGPCNSRKHAQDWRTFLHSVSTPEEFARRAARIEDFQRTYRYAVGVSLAKIAAQLHSEVKLLIEQKVLEAEPLIADMDAE